MNIKPMPGYLVTRPLKLQETVTKGGVIVAIEKEKRGRLESTQHGKIVAINYKDQKQKDRMGLEIDDEIIYGEFAGFEADIELTRYRFLSIEDIRAKIIT